MFKGVSSLFVGYKSEEKVYFKGNSELFQRDINPLSNVFSGLCITLNAII